MEQSTKIIIRLLARIAGALEKKPYEDILEEEIRNTSKAKSEPKPQVNTDIVDKIYKLYPTTTETKDGKRSTGKSAKDRSRIQNLLKTHTAEQLENAIKKYVEEQGGKYLKNFSTFLNNLPEYEDADTKTEPGTQETPIFTQQPDGMEDYIRERRAFYDNL